METKIRSITLSQEEDCCGRPDADEQELTVSCANGGGEGDDYVVISTERWAIEPEDIPAFAEKLTSVLPKTPAPAAANCLPPKAPLLAGDKGAEVFVPSSEGHIVRLSDGSVWTKGAIEAAFKRAGRMGNLKAEVAKWQGKFAIVARENNALRRKPSDQKANDEVLREARQLRALRARLRKEVSGLRWQGNNLRGRYDLPNAEGEKAREAGRGLGLLDAAHGLEGILNQSLETVPDESMALRHENNRLRGWLRAVDIRLSKYQCGDFENSRDALDYVQNLIQSVLNGPAAGQEAVVTLEPEEEGE